MDYSDYDDPELIEDEGYENSIDANLLSDEYLDDEGDLLIEFSTYLESLSDDDLVTQFKTWKAWLQETADKIATAPSFENLGSLLQEFDDRALHIQLIQSIYYENFGKELY